MTGNMFIETSIVVCMHMVGVAMLLAVRRRGLVVPPRWRRSPQAALDGTQPA